ncbi:hypothetical protein L2E82_03458 [Cichorium intybus]|uniref:Uncharacterized protein n=1 Tax=Cichorium intybus TaxID=13427 RepID=A0ACB9H417_CICIN|nr:hypothetical protein L2E82_03458 [Cichorium intybus]
MEGKIFEQFLKAEIDEEREDKMDEEGEGDDRSWSSEDEESEDSSGEEVDEQADHVKKAKKDVDTKESFVAESSESAQACFLNNKKVHVEVNTHPTSPGRGESDQEGKRPNKSEPIIDGGPKDNGGKVKEVSKHPNKEEVDKWESNPVSLESNCIQRGEVSEKLKKLLSKKIPIEEKLEMMGRELTETQ